MTRWCALRLPTSSPRHRGLLSPARLRQRAQVLVPLYLRRPHAQVVAAVLLFRVLTYGLQIPLGGFTYIIWRRKKSWFKTPPDHHVDVGEPALALTGSP